MNQTTSSSVRRIVAVTLLVAALVLVLAGLVTAPGCSADRAENTRQFDEAVQIVDNRRAEIEQALNQQRDKLLAAFQQQRESLQREIAELKAQLTAKPDAAPQIQPKIDAAETIAAKIDATWNATTKKLEDVQVQIFQKFDEVRATMTAQREKITSGDPGQQVQAGAQIISQHVPGQAGIYIGLIGTAIGGLLSAFHQARQKNSTKAAAVEAIGTMSTAIASGLVPLSEPAAAALRDAQSQKARDLVDEADRFYRDAMKLVTPSTPSTPSAPSATATTTAPA